MESTYYWKKNLLIFFSLPWSLLCSAKTTYLGSIVEFRVTTKHYLFLICKISCHFLIHFLTCSPMVNFVLGGPV